MLEFYVLFLAVHTDCQMLCFFSFEYLVVNRSHTKRSEVTAAVEALTPSRAPATAMATAWALGLWRRLPALAAAAKSSLGFSYLKRVA